MKNNEWYETDNAFIYVSDEDDERLYYHIRINEYDTGVELTFNSAFLKVKGQLMDNWRPLSRKEDAITLLFKSKKNV